MPYLHLHSVDIRLCMHRYWGTWPFEYSIFFQTVVLSSEILTPSSREAVEYTERGDLVQRLSTTQHLFMLTSSVRLAISQSSANISTLHSCEPVGKLDKRDLCISTDIRCALSQDKAYCLFANVGHVWKDLNRQRSFPFTVVLFWYIISTEFLICRVIDVYAVKYESLPLKQVEGPASTKWHGELNLRSAKETPVILPKTFTKTNDPWRLSVSPNCLGLPPSMSQSWARIPYCRLMTSIECINGCCHYRRGPSGFRSIAWHRKEKLLFAFWIPSELKMKSGCVSEPVFVGGWGGKPFESWIAESLNRVAEVEKGIATWIWMRGSKVDGYSIDALFRAWADVVGKGWNRHICIRRESRKTQFQLTLRSHSHFEQGLPRVFCGSRYLKTAMKRGMSKSRIFHWFTSSIPRLHSQEFK